MSMISSAKHSRSAYTLIELMIVVLVLSILAGLVYFAVGSWRQRVAVTEVKSDLSNLQSAMDSAKNWSNGYPIFTAGSVFDGSNSAMKTIYVQNKNVKLTYYSGDSSTYCVDAVSKVTSSVYYFFDASGGNKDIKIGTCAGGEGSSPVPTGPSQTLFAFDTTATGCTGTVQLPIDSPTSAPGSTINWGDGSTEALSVARQSHTYSKAGIYTVSYDGPITTFSNKLVLAANQKCLTKLNQWGSTALPTSVNFSGARNLTYVVEPPHSVTSMSEMFNGASSFNQDISGWDVSNVVSMNNMFQSATAFNQNISGWNVSNVTNMASMFVDAWAFNQNISGWNVSNVTNMAYMLKNAKVFNQPIGTWNTSKVTSMTYMFNGALAFNQPLNSWNTSQVTNMMAMFYDTDAFNQPLNSWNTSQATNMSYMFYDATAFNQPLNAWNTTKVTNVSYMFRAASAFNQNISGWNTTAVTTKTDFHRDSPLIQANCPSTLW